MATGSESESVNEACDDFRDFFRREYSRRCANRTGYTLAEFARSLSILPQQLHQILFSNKGISPARAEFVNMHLGLTHEEALLFAALVARNHAKSPLMKSEAERRLRILREPKLKSAQASTTLNYSVRLPHQSSRDILLSEIKTFFCGLNDLIEDHPENQSASQSRVEIQIAIRADESVEST